MQDTGHNSKSTRRLFTSAFVFFCLLLAPTLRATVTLEIYFEDGAIPNGALAAIVADQAVNGFSPLTDPAVSGTSLSPGSTIGGSDDRILAVFNAMSGTSWGGGAGLADTLAALDYNIHGIAEGTPLAVYVFPGLTSPGATFILGDRYVVYRNINSGGSGGEIPFSAPADPGVYMIAALTSGTGGSFDPQNLQPGETYLRGNAGSTGGGEPGDVGNSREESTLLSGGIFPSDLSAGDLDFFRFVITEPSVLSASLNAQILAQAWVFDENGNIIYSPDGSPFDFEEILQPGTYYIALQGENDLVEGEYNISVASRGIILARPDLSVGKSSSRQKGVGLFTTSGAGQQYVAKSKKGRKVRSFFMIGNAGDLEGPLRVRGSGGNRFYKLKYLSLGGAGNITGSVKRGGFLTDYSPSQKILYRLDLKPTKEGKARGKSGKFSIDSSGSGGADRGKVKVKFLKK